MQERPLAWVAPRDTGTMAPSAGRGRRPRAGGAPNPALLLLALLAILLGPLTRLAASLPPRVWILGLLPALVIGAGMLVWSLAPWAQRSLRAGPALPAALPTATTALPPTPTPLRCRFVLGFAALRELIPDEVGECVADESVDPVTGDIVQPTATGLLVWRKVDNATGFTDGQGTWLNGPNGLVYRPNTVRLPWESNPTRLPVVQEGHLSLALPGAVLPAQRVVAYYGHPSAPAMGILGQRPPEQMLPALERQAQQYTAADPTTPVRPALHLVASVAMVSPGPDGLYRRRAAAEEIEGVARWAEGRGYLLILDIQPGRSPISSEVEALMPYLSRPYVHLALDPEWAMAPNQVPGETFGSVDATVVNQTITTLARLVSRQRLPPKMLIVHRFREDMLTNYRQIRPDPRVQVVIAMDGVGPPNSKADVYRQLVRDQPVQFAGLKIFLTQDERPFTPRQALSLQPVPHVIIYQ